MLALHNHERLLKKGTPPLSINKALAYAAQAHATWMADHLIYDHTGEGGSSVMHRARLAGYTGTVVAENIHRGPGLDAWTCWIKWRESPHHLRNATSPAYREVGFGSALGRDGQTYWCAVYGGGAP